MLRRSMAIGSIAVLLAAGGCSSDDGSDAPAGDASAVGLCERIGTDALTKVLPRFTPDAPGEGDPKACVRPADPDAPGDFLRITVEEPTPGTEEECVNLERDSSSPGRTWMPAEHLRGVGEVACGNVLTNPDGGVLVILLSRRGTTNVSFSVGRTPGEVTAVREAAIGLATTVMRRV